MAYKFAPLREAIFDLRIDHLEVGTVAQLEKIHEQIASIYPLKKKQINFTGKIELKDNVEVKNESNSEFRGFLFSNKENSRQVQIRLDGFTFNMLKPYTEWEDFSKEAFRLWEIYNKKLKPKSIVRIALRYINRINIPLPMKSFQEYIVNMPPIPQSLPQTFRNFFMQIDVPIVKEGANVILTETIEKTSLSFIPFILDIDVYKSGKIENDLESLRSEFEKLRILKNSTFENCITDKSRNLFK